MNVVNGQPLAFLPNTLAPSVTVGSTDGFLVAPRANRSVGMIIRGLAACGYKSVLNALILSMRFLFLTITKLRPQRPMILSVNFGRVPLYSMTPRQIRPVPEASVESLPSSISGGGAAELGTGAVDSLHELDLLILSSSGLRSGQICLITVGRFSRPFSGSAMSQGDLSQKGTSPKLVIFDESDGSHSHQVRFDVFYPTKTYFFTLRASLPLLLRV